MNPDITNLPGERWKDIPWLKGYVKISNKGRVKRLAREVFDERGFSYILQERIQKIKLHKFYNRHLKEYTYHTSTRVNIEKKNYRISISRVVYYCFVRRFDLDDKSILIIPRDHDRFNMTPENLMKVTYKGFQEHIRISSRRESGFWKHNNTGIPFFSIGHKSHEKQVSSYDKKGKLIQTYESIAKAAKDMGVFPGAISRAVHNKGTTSAGYLWALGNEKRITIAAEKQ